MQVRVKLMGVLKAKSPEGDKLELPDGSTVRQALVVLDISTDRVHVFSINGTLERNLDRRLEPNDELTVLAPVGGG